MTALARAIRIARPHVPAPVAILAAGALLFWMCRVHPGRLPAWAPWDFSWPEFLGCALPLSWYLRGLALTQPGRRPAAWRTACFLAGLAAIYAVLQTHFDYLAQHMFFLNRTQHVVMHHVGPFLIGIAGGGPVLRRGMPRAVRRLCGSRPSALALRLLQQPVVATSLFVGLFYFWLIPAVQFRAMIDPHLYALMNWSMVADGLLFYAAVLDPRPAPPARNPHYVRAAMAWATTFPAIVIGCYLTSIGRDLYPYYDLCGRVIPSIDALTDQRIGFVIVWVLPAMMGAASTVIALRAFFTQDEPAPPPPDLIPLDTAAE